MIGSGAPRTSGEGSREDPGGVAGGSGGLFVAFEGGDGAGKSTQARLVAEAFDETGRETVVTRQPGGTGLGEQLRALVLHGGHVGARAEALVFAADKAQHVAEVVGPALARGAVVVTDRYTDSSVAYQGAGRDLGAAEVHDLQMWAVDGLLPDLTVVLDVPSDEGRRRRGGQHDRLESEADAFHDAIRAHFLAIARAAPERYVLLDGTAPVEDVQAQVRDALRSRGWLP